MAPKKRQMKSGRGTVDLGARMQIGIAAYLRNLAVRCNKIARATSDSRAHDELTAISSELTDKAEALETTFNVPKEQR
jgi:hypothetical protein